MEEGEVACMRVPNIMCASYVLCLILTLLDFLFMDVFIAKADELQTRTDQLKFMPLHHPVLSQKQCGPGGSDISDEAYQQISPP